MVYMPCLFWNFTWAVMYTGYLESMSTSYLERVFMLGIFPPYSVQYVVVRTFPTAHISNGISTLHCRDTIYMYCATRHAFSRPVTDYPYSNSVILIYYGMVQ